MLPTWHSGFGKTKRKKKAANSYSTPESYFPLQLATARGGEEASKQLANNLLQEAVLAQDKLEQQWEEKPAFALNPEQVKSQLMKDHKHTYKVGCVS